MDGQPETPDEAVQVLGMPAMAEDQRYGYSLGGPAHRDPLWMSHDLDEEIVDVQLLEQGREQSP
jgi:hypothetical protein